MTVVKITPWRNFHDGDCRIKFMKYPNFKEEKKLRQCGYKRIAGLDEAGRGPLAGPVVAAAVALCNFQFSISNFQSIFNDPIFKKIKDSKKMSARAREEVYNVLIKHPNIEWGIGIISEKVIDKINILEATKLAMNKSIKKLKPDFLILDGNFNLDVDLPQKSIIKGDQKIISISAASIIAKVTRDRIMKKYDKKYPQYQFDKHKGYCTELHVKMLKKFGACPIHRKSFNVPSRYK